jgi:hypothetical protein
MIIFRGTQKFLKFQKIKPSPMSVVSRALFGEWYVNLIPTFRGDVCLFTNDPCLLSVVLPLSWDLDIEKDFKERILNLYRRLAFPEEFVNYELDEMDSFIYTKTASPSILGVMNDVAYNLQSWAEELVPGFGDTLESFELAASQTPHKMQYAKDYEFPRDIARRMIEERFKIQNPK